MSSKGKVLVLKRDIIGSYYIKYPAGAIWLNAYRKNTDGSVDIAFGHGDWGNVGPGGWDEFSYQEAMLHVYNQLKLANKKVADYKQVNDEGLKIISDQRSLIDQLQTELNEQSRLNGIGSEREAKLEARITALETELAEARAEIERLTEMSDDMLSALRGKK